MRLLLSRIRPIERSAIVVARLCHMMSKLKALCRPVRKSVKGCAIAFLCDDPEKQRIYCMKIKKQSNKRNDERD